MKKTTVKEIACLVVLLVFIIVLVAENRVSNAEPQEVFEAVSAASQMKKLKKCKAVKFKREFGFSADEFESVIYYGSSDVMEVRELLIVRVKDASQTKPLTQAITSRIEEKAGLFKGYAPKQSAMLDSYVLEEKGGFVLFAVCDSPGNVSSSFKKAV